MFLIFKIKKPDNNVLLAALLALLARLIACVAILTTTFSDFKRRLNISSRLWNLLVRDKGWWDNVQAGKQGHFARHC